MRPSRAARFAAILLLAFAGTAFAANEPTADWNPDPDPSSPEGVDNPGAVASADGTAEITITTGTASLTGTPTGGLVSAGSVALITCSVSQLSGPAGTLQIVGPIGFSMARLSDTSWSPPGTITLGCVATTQPVTGLLTCDQTPKFPPGRTIKTWWDVSCPAATAPEWSSTPNNGTAINLTTTVGTPATGTVTVNNTGLSDLVVNPTGLSGALSVTSPGVDTSIAPGASSVFTVTCNPASASTSNQTLSFDTNDPTGGEDPVTFPVQCVGNAAAAPEFGSTPGAGATIAITSAIGNPSTSILNIANTGTATLTGTLAGLSGVLSVSSPTLNVANGANQNFTITCTPAAATTVVQTLTVTHNDADESPASYTVQCTGSAAPAPEFSSTPVAGSTIDITSDVGVLATSVVAVTNTGNANLTASAAIGGAPVFGVTPASPGPITPSGNQNFTVQCTPAAVGTVTQTLTLTTNDSDEGTVTYSVNCIGQAPEFDAVPAAPGPITLTATQGGTAPTAIITVSNTGVRPLNATPSGLSGRLSVAPATLQTIAPGNNVVFTVSCTTATAGTASQTLSFATNDPDENPVAYNVSCDVGGSAADEFFSNPAPGPITITTSPGVTGNASILVQNVGGATLTAVAASFVAAPPAELSAAPLPGPTTIAAGASQVYTVSCTSAVPGTFAATFRVVHSDGPESPADFPITCNVANLAPDYGSTPPATSTIAISAVVGGSNTGTLTARNIGGGTLNVSAAIPAGFITVAPPGPTPIAAGGSTALTLTCTPTSTTTQTRTLTVTTDEPTGPTSYTYTVTCTGLAPAGGEFDPSVPNGGTITLNTTRGTSVSQPLTVTNSGATTLTISGAAIAPVLTEITLSPGAPQTINPGLTRNFNLTCLSPNPGVYNATLTFNTSDTDEATVNFNVTCVVADIPPDFNTLQNPATPITINAVLFSTATATITVQNTAAATGGTLNVGVSPLSSPLSVAPPTVVLGPAGQQDVTISCSPTISGFPPIIQVGTFTQLLTFTSNDPDENPVNFIVTCNAGFAPQPEFSSAPDPGQTITLNTIVGTAVTSPLRVSNSGTLPDSITPSLAGSPTITVTPSSVVPIGPGAFSDFVVSCTPTAAGQTTATLTLGSTDVDEPVNTYNVVCNAGAAPEPELTSLPVSGFPISLVGLPQSNVPASIGVTNVGNFTLRLLSCQATGPGFSVSAPPAFPVDIAPADSAVVTVVCNVPPIGVPVTGTLTCQTSDADEATISFPLACTGQIPPPVNVPGPRGPWLLALALALLGLAGFTLSGRGLQRPGPVR